MQAIDATELGRVGVVIEQNFPEITTYGIGQVHVGDLLASYYVLSAWPGITMVQKCTAAAPLIKWLPRAAPTPLRC